MAIYPKVEHGKRAGVHDAEPIRLSRLEWQGGILVEPDVGSYGRGVCPGNWAQVRAILGKVD